ncbi:MAG: V-type ATP synthase subunit E family protein [Spirochaetota bacterium]
MTLKDSIIEKGEAELAGIAARADEEIAGILSDAKMEAERIVREAEKTADEADMRAQKRDADRIGITVRAKESRAREKLFSQLKEKIIIRAAEMIRHHYPSAAAELAVQGAGHIGENLIDLALCDADRDIFTRSEEQIRKNISSHGISLRNISFAPGNAGGLTVSSSDGRRICTLTLEENFRRIEDEIRGALHEKLI